MPTTSQVHFSPAFKKHLFNRKIVGFASADVGADRPWPALQLDDGSMLIIQSDAEGNDGGFMLLVDKVGETIGGAGN